MHAGSGDLDLLHEYDYQKFQSRKRTSHYWRPNPRKVPPYRHQPTFGHAAPCSQHPCKSSRPWTEGMSIGMVSSVGAILPSSSATERHHRQHSGIVVSWSGIIISPSTDRNRHRNTLSRFQLASRHAKPKPDREHHAQWSSSPTVDWRWHRLAPR
jgi:hypothetical protein